MREQLLTTIRFSVEGNTLLATLVDSSNKLLWAREFQARIKSIDILENGHVLVQQAGDETLYEVDHR